MISNSNSTNTNENINNQIFHSKINHKQIENITVESNTSNVKSSITQTKKSSKSASIPGKPRGATYDGNICMICSDRASGFHYGVLACEGCKGFFKRVCKEKLNSSSSDSISSKTVFSQQNKRHCVFGGNCEINVKTRNRCQYCRIQKCIELGMSKDGIKLGRRSKKFKQNLNSSIQTNSSINKTKDNLTIQVKKEDLDSNTNKNDLNNQQIFAILQDNKLIIKAIDILSAVSAVAATASNTTLTETPTLAMNNEQSKTATKIDSNLSQDQNNILIISPTTSNSQEIQSNQLNPQTNPIILLNGVNIPNIISQQANLLNSIVILNNNNNTSVNSTQNTSNDSSHNNNINNNKPINKVNLDTNQVKVLIDSIVKAYKDTSIAYNYTQLPELDENSSIERNESLKSMFDLGLLQFLNQSKFLDHINTLIENTVLFAKNVPLFMNINESDRITLLKSSVFEIICLRHSYFYKLNNNVNEKYLVNNNNNLVTLATCALANESNDKLEVYMDAKFVLPYFNVWFKFDWLSSKLVELRDFLRKMLEFYFYFKQMNLNDLEIGLFCAYLLFKTDQSLNDSDKLGSYRMLYYELLLNELEKTRLHSSNVEKIETDIKCIKKENLAQWLNTCCLKLKELNLEHVKILNAFKQFIQFPDLYAELYNL